MPLNKNTDNRYEILNTYVNAISMDETIRRVEEIIKRGIPTQHVVINASKVNLMEKDLKLRKIVNACPLINADGASIVWAAKKLGVPLKERVTGIDLFQRLVELSDKKGYKIYLFGAKEEVVTKVKKIFEDKYPNGIKLINGNGEKMDEDTISLVEAYLDGNLNVFGKDYAEIPYAHWDRIGCTVDYVSGRNRYVGYLISLGVYSFKGMKVGLDCANGSSWNIAKVVFDLKK